MSEKKGCPPDPHPELSRRAIEGLKLEPGLASIIVPLAIFFPGWSTIIVGIFAAKNDDQKKAIFTIGFLHLILCCICVGWCLAIKWALDVKRQSM